jgi:ATP-dependent Clp protease ATP-binding subunit ClpB
MDVSKFSEKAREALKVADELARSKGHPELCPLHLASAVWGDETGLARSLCAKSGCAIDAVRAALNAAVAKLPTQSPPPDIISPNSAVIRVLRAAEASAKALKDSHASVDHLIVALANCNDKPLRAALEAGGVKADALAKAVETVRGGRPVTSSKSDQMFDSLEKFGVDLVALAEQGKLDPVIGRDDVVARVVRILSRKTKNVSVCALSMRACRCARP